MSARKTRSRKGDNRPTGPSGSIPTLEVGRFFLEVEQRAWTDAEKEMDGIREKSDGGDWSRGYVKALEGLLLTFKGNDDKYIFLPKLLAGSSEGLGNLKKEFADFASNDLHGDYDRGFFKAMEDYLASLPAGKVVREESSVPKLPLEVPAAKQDSDEAGC